MILNRLYIFCSNSNPLLLDWILENVYPDLNERFKGGSFYMTEYNNIEQNTDKYTSMVLSSGNFTNALLTIYAH